MSPFLHFRTWLRSGPVGERLMLLTVGGLLLSLLAWAATPYGGVPTATLAGDQAVAQSSAGTSTTQGASGAAAVGQPGGAGAPVPSGTSPGAVAGVDGGLLAGTVPARPSAPSGQVLSGVSPGRGGSRTPASSCGPMTATDQGVTATTITVGAIIVDLAAANNLLSIPSADDQIKAYDAVVADVNSRGGVRCRKLVAKYYKPNPLNATEEHSACLQMQEDKLFAVFNNLISVTEQTCIAKQGIPNFWYTPPHSGDVKQYAPYILAWNADFDRLIHQYIFGSQSVGFFKGMKRLGILEESCYPDENVAVRKELTVIGIDPSKASVFNYGCASFSSPQAEQQAVLQFKREGVTHVVNVAYAHDSNFSKAGDQQDYKPKFTHMEDASAAAIESASAPPGDTFDGTLLIATTETGAAHTPGYRFNAPTRACTKLLADNGLPSAYSPGLNSLYGVACINAAMFKAAAENASSLVRRQLSAGLVRAGPLTLPYPAGPLHVTSPNLPTGGHVWRHGVWRTSCQCWQLTNVTYRSTY